jgi:hypothetical protein
VENGLLASCGHSENWKTFLDAFWWLDKPELKHMASLRVYIWVENDLDTHFFKASIKDISIGLEQLCY